MKIITFFFFSRSNQFYYVSAKHYYYLSMIILCVQIFVMYHFTTSKTIFLISEINFQFCFFLAGGKLMDCNATN